MDHHDGNGRGRLPRGYRRCSRYRNDYVNRERDEFSCQRGQPFQLAFGLTLLNYDGLAVDIASLRQASHYAVTRYFVHDKQANARELSLLRACRRGPPHRGCEPKQDLPSPDFDHLVYAPAYDTAFTQPPDTKIHCQPDGRHNF